MTTRLTLGSQIRPKERYLRAANLEAHQDHVGHYIPTSRALEVLRRLAHSMDESGGGRSWSLTGPYGAGKSSFALFLRTLLGHPGNLRESAERSLREADEALYVSLTEARASVGGENGFVLATTTCQQEPLAESLLRALVSGSKARWPEQIPDAISRALTAAHRSKTAREIAAAARTIAEFAPVLLVLDEFGKTLEHFAGRTTEGSDASADLFVLQELAETATGQRAVPIFTFTLQHLAFDDYVREASLQQRREWGKVQGRFEDISFLESAEQSLRLVSGALDASGMSREMSERRQHWAETALAAARETGIANHIPGGAETIAKCYPLHPVALLALPELCGQLGQHGRTLFTFLASTEPGSARNFLESTDIPGDGKPLPLIALSDLFDFFAGSGQAMALSIGGGRWREIHERVREAGSLDETDLAVLKSVGLLNLMGNSIGLRASSDLVAFALSDLSGRVEPNWRSRLEDLESRGFLTFRSFADEYRLWRGSDVDLRGRVADAREQLRSTNAADLLGRLQSDAPMIAARHSQHVGMLRYFSVGYTDDGSRALPALAEDSPADGVVVYHLGASNTAPQLGGETDGRPTVLVTSGQSYRVRNAAIEVAAALTVLDQEEVLEDHVARRELQDRVADARTRLSQALADTFRPGAQGVNFQLVAAEGSITLSCTHGLSRLLSDVCDEAYGHSPHIRNEMLGRRELTSQGAKARRLLVEAMIEHGNTERLGLQGYGPERAMYEAVLRHTGLHAERKGTWSFGPPGRDGSLQHVWRSIEQFVDSASDSAVSLDHLYRRLMAPPIGLKEGPIPVLLVAYLLQREDDVAIYEDGTFQPNLAVDLVERLMKAPKRFALKSFGSTGNRVEILSAISKATASLGVGGLSTLGTKRIRNETVLAVAAPLLNLVRSMPTYTKRTSNLTAQTLAVRAALLGAREPDRLLLVELPAACGFESQAWENPSRSSIAKFGKSLQLSLTELREAYERQLLEIRDLLAEAFDRPSDVRNLRKVLQVRCEPLQGRVLNPKLQAFIFNAADETPDDAGWLGRMGLTLTGKSVELWLDDDRTRFRSFLMETVTAFHRVEALHFDARAESREGAFSARRLTITTPEGDESSRVVFYDESSVHALAGLAEEALERAEKLAGGPHGRDGLTALIVERILRSTSETQNEFGPVSDEETVRKAGNGRR
ncbi:hypothetical protein [Paenarthrobacter ureafaciens]|uniref:hypothetical protein n=1 Tax=Paenarthrobacter ureafaciens TaxID=37931 RepID=UPI00140DB777|nr:hypothetical protein [Paenarthrobacter ureafaciens]MCX8456271.1 hypothetical protein [Paenarthrobacter ureafaciens]MCY0972277.1 hypothetical protein [Paenarthrobacter ureafaciens]